VQSSCGHDAFLLPNDLHAYGGMMNAFLKHVDPASGTEALAEKEAHGPTSIFHRFDYDRIAELIPAGASVLDLGCGSGGLLSRLKVINHRRLVGAELDEAKILTCINRGLDVIQIDLNRDLGAAFRAGQFDCVLLSQTLQAVQDVEGVISQMLRIGRQGIVSIPNFGYRRLRHMLSEEGRAPKSGVLHYEWYNTPNIRFFTITDFEEFCARKGIRVHRRVALDTETGKEITDDPNLNADLAIFVLSRSETSSPA
jgi:methionine biosynthesis protein MetW